jgi:2-C-methyl-D-erythritol 4-phosphate cytidylyltransferase
MNKYAIIVAGGSGSRMGSETPKQFLLLHGKPLLMLTLAAFFEADASVIINLVLPKSQISVWLSLCETYHFKIPHRLIEGGQTRFQSVRNAIKMLPSNGLVAIHDGVRPLVSSQIILKSFEIAAQNGSAVAAVKPKDSIRMAKENQTIAVDRNQYFLVQTPQTFAIGLIKMAFLQDESPNFTDDASVFEANGGKITLFEGDYRNIKITTPEDLTIASVILRK